MTYDLNELSSHFQQQFPRLSNAEMHGDGQETMDVIALLGMTDAVMAASSMRRLGWTDSEISRWLGA
jgi:hypothetical protein